MRYKSVYLITIISLLFFRQAGFGQLNDSIIRMDEVRVVSDRLSRAESRTGRQISIINAEQIRVLPVNSVDELLRYIPFMEVQSRGPYGAQSDILMRGSTFNQVLVLLDGMRVNDPLTGHFNSNIPVSLSEISRIEVYRGPASAIYGPDAMGGVVHIISHTFEQGKSPGTIEGRLEAWYGEHNLRRTNSGINLSRGKWKAGAGLSYHASDGHPLDPDSLRGDFSVLTGSISLAGEISERISVSLRTSVDSRNFNARFFYTNSPYDLSREEVNRWWNQGLIRFRINEKHRLNLLAGYQATRDSFIFNPAFPANIHRTQYQNYQLDHQYITGQGFRLASGIQYDYKQITSQDRGNHLHWHAGVYLIVSYDFNKNLGAGAGLRLDQDQLYGLQALPQVNLTYKAGNWNFRTSAGRSIRSPDFTERYISTGLEGPLAPGRNIGNPALRAEWAWSIEAGADRKITRTIDGSLTGFYRFGRDLIDYVVTPAGDISNNLNLIPGENYFHTRNIGILNTGGLEIMLRGNHEVQEDLAMDWSLSWQGIMHESDSAVISKYLASTARSLWIAGLGIGSNGFSIRMNGMYKTREPEIAREINRKLETSYLVLNLRADKYFLERRLQLSIQVNNLFDRNYSDIMGATMPGRWISGGMTWNFYR